MKKAIISVEIKELIQVKETAAPINTIDSDEDIKRQTRLIAKSQECPTVTGTFGENGETETFVNPFCHIRSDLN